ncbi:hypothetical protein BGX27_004374 [Mortierella sp. AM989]|nr:hypothetical protein BGX27_004374 [Mortierella sp. AM989]
MSSAHGYTNQSTVKNTATSYSREVKVFDFGGDGIEHETPRAMVYDNQSDSEDQSIPLPPETPSSFSHGIAILRTPDYMVNRALTSLQSPQRDSFTTEFELHHQGGRDSDRDYEDVPYEVEEPQDVMPREDDIELRGRNNAQLTKYDKVYALEASPDDIGIESGQTIKSIDLSTKSSQKESGDTEEIEKRSEVSSDHRRRLSSSLITDAIKSPKQVRPRRAASTVKKNATIGAQKMSDTQCYQKSEAETTTMRLKTLLGKGFTANHSTSNRNESVNLQTIEKESQPSLISEEEHAEVPEVRKKRRPRPETVASTKHQKAPEINNVYVTELVVPKAKQPEVDNNEVRRSRREKFKPLEYWKNEKLVLGRSDNTPVPVPVVKAVIRAAPVEQKRFLAKRKPAAREPSSSLKIKSRTERPLIKKRRKVDVSRNPTHEDLVDGNNQSEDSSEIIDLDQNCFEDQCPQLCETLDDEGNVVVRAVVEEPGSAHFQDASSGQYKYHRGLEDELISSGIVRIPGGGVKPNQNAFASSVAYYVMQGTIKATIYKNTIVLRRGGRFLVPRGNQYMIENLSRNDCLLFFVQSKTAAINKNIKNGTGSGKSLAASPTMNPTTKATTQSSESYIDRVDDQEHPLKSRTPNRYGSKNSTRRFSTTNTAESHNTTTVRKKDMKSKV